MVIVHFPGRFLSGFSPQLSFFTPAVNFTLLFFYGILDKLYDFIGYQVPFETIIQLCGTIAYAFLLSIPVIAKFFVWFRSPRGCIDQCIVDLLFLLFPCGIISVHRGTVRGLLTSSKFPSCSLAAFFLFFLYIFTNPSARAGYDTRSIFKRSLTSLNSEFSFS